MKSSLRNVLAACLFGFGVASNALAQTAVTKLWSLSLSSYYSDSSPALAPDGTIYQADFNGQIFAITPHGQTKWTLKIGCEIKSSPAVAPDGTIYFGSRDRKFYAVTPEGKIKWTFATGAWIDSSPAIAADGTVYFGSWDANFYALNPDGSKKWIFPVGGIIDSSPAIAADGTIYFGSHDKFLYALMPDGKPRWKFPTQGPVISSPALNPDGTIYFTSTDGNLYAVKPDGSELWRLHTGGASESSPVLDAPGEIYVGGSYAKFGVSASGKQIWGYGAPLFVDATPAVATNGWIYFSSPWHELAAFDPNGNLKCEFGMGDLITGSPVIGNDGTIYVAAGRIFMALGVTNNAPLAKSSWPMFRANPQHTGRIETR